MLFTKDQEVSLCTWQSVMTIWRTENKWNGRILDITHWLKEKIHRFGSMYNSKEVIERVCGKEISAQPLLRYFEEKYSKVYEF